MLRKFFPAAALVLCLPNAALAQCKIERQTTVPLTLLHNRAIVPMSINETPGQFEIDTGSDDTILSAEYAKASHVGIDRHANEQVTIGVGNKETLPAFPVHARHIQFGDIPFYDWEFTASNSEIFPSEHISGLLGRDFMHYFDIELDLTDGKMTVWRLFNCTELTPPWKGDYDTIPMKKIKGSAMTMPIWIDNAFMDVILDTGAGGLIITHTAANRAGASDARLAQDEQAGGQGLGGGFQAARHQFGTLLIGSQEIRSPYVRVDPTDTSTSGIKAYSGADGLIGLAPLHAQRLWISFGTATLFVQNGPKK
jgi:predicted aspartyl protease